MRVVAGAGKLEFTESVMKFEPLPRSFYLPSAEVVAPRLLGHWLVRRTAKGLMAGRIVETEAYLIGDPACHGYVGETARNRVMYGPPGFGYVYLIYGYYYCFNTVCLTKGSAEAVLVRAVEAEVGDDLMQKNRPAKATKDLTNGPGKLCDAMEITRELDGADLCSAESAVFIARNEELEQFLKERGPMITTTRIGLTKAADLPLRYYLDGSKFVSKRIAKSRTKRVAQ
jgi:DNA-3-methyladenine glycosylase